MQSSLPSGGTIDGIREVAVAAAGGDTVGNISLTTTGGPDAVTFTTTGALFPATHGLGWDGIANNAEDGISGSLNLDLTSEGLNTNAIEVVILPNVVAILPTAVAP